MLRYAVPRGLKQWAQVYHLYQKAFPASEKKPFSVIMKKFREGKTHIWRFVREGKFAGIVITINGGSHILIDYLAVEASQRGTGIGSDILTLMRSHYEGKSVFLEIESVYEDCDNKAERVRRKHFYEKCGMESMEVFVWLFDVKMELMGFGCKLSFEDYHNFYRDNYGPWAADHIQEAEK